MNSSAEESELSKIAKKLGRRSFVKGAGITGMGLASLAFGGSKALGLGFPEYPGAPDVDVALVNFALNLEYLEAEFYTVATTGKTIEESGIGITGVGDSGPTTGGQMVDFASTNGEVSGMLAKVAAEITHDEQTHVTLLRSLLGDAAVAKPAINLGALGYGFANFKQFLLLARAFEDTGVTAYSGAANRFTNPSFLEYAVKIALTEAFHASNIRLLLAENKQASIAVDKIDILPPPSGTQYFAVDFRALALSRSVNQVLSIVYGSSAKGTDKGGFFPNGLNGQFTIISA
jgi:hypothetical protein